MKAMLISLIMMASAAALAGSTTCHIQASVRTSAAASLYVICDDGREGYIDNNTQISSITFRTVGEVVESKILTLNNPPGKLADYKAGKDHPWVKSQIAAQDIDHVQAGYATAFTVAGSPRLFDDFAETETSTKSKSSSVGVSDGYKCIKTDEDKMGANGMCSMRVFCTKDSQGGDDSADCGKSCPDTLQACLDYGNAKGSGSSSTPTGGGGHRGVQ